MQSKIEQRLSELFDESILGKLFRFLSYSQGQSNTNEEYFEIVKWSPVNPNKIQIRDAKRFNKYIYEAPMKIFHFGPFKPFGFRVLKGYLSIEHSEIQKDTPKSKWKKIWQQTITRQFFSRNSELLGLFLLLQLSKQQQIKPTDRNKSPVCWSDSHETIFINDYKEMMKFIIPQYDHFVYFPRALYGFQTISPHQMSHKMLNKNSPLEAWIIVFLEAKAKRKVLQIKVREKAREKRLERSQNKYEKKIVQPKKIQQLVLDPKTDDIIKFLFGQTQEQPEYKQIVKIQQPQKPARPKPKKRIDACNNIQQQVDHIINLRQIEDIFNVNPTALIENNLQHNQKKVRKKMNACYDRYNINAVEKTKPYVEGQDEQSHLMTSKRGKHSWLKRVKNEVKDIFKKMLADITRIGNKHPKMYKQLMIPFKCSTQVVAEDSDIQE